MARDPAVSEPNHPIPRPDLTTVSVARELEVDAQLAGVRECTRAMREEDDRPARIAAPERAIETFFATLAAPQQMTSLVVDSGQIETALTRRDCNALVSQQAPTKFPTAIHPGLDAGIDFVIPGDELHALRGLERLQGLDLHSDVLDGSVHEISGYDHEVGLEHVYALRDPGSKAAAMYRTDVKVRDLDDPVSIEACWPARERDLEPPGIWKSETAVESTSRRDQGNGERQECAAPRRLHRTPVCAAPAGRGEKSDHGVEGIARQCREHQQQDKSEPHILEPEVDSGKRATTAQRQHYENDREKPNGGEGEQGCFEWGGHEGASTIRCTTYRCAMLTAARKPAWNTEQRVVNESGDHSPTRL